MPMFWLIKLDFLSLKGNAVSSSTFWGVYGFSMSLGSPSGFGIFRHVYFCSHVKVALSAYLQGHQPPTCPWNLCQCFCFWIPPCTASQSCMGFPQPHELVLCVAGLLHLFAFVLAHGPILYVSGLVCTCFSSPFHPSASRGLCVLASAPGARPLH